MLRIINGTNISYTRGDTFDLRISSETGFNDGSTLRFTVAKNEDSGALILNEYSLGSDGAFRVTLNDKDKQTLGIGDYVYKLTVLTLSGIVVTQKSGDFAVKWGA